MVLDPEERLAIPAIDRRSWEQLVTLIAVNADLLATISADPDVVQAAGAIEKAVRRLGEVLAELAATIPGTAPSDFEADARPLRSPRFGRLSAGGITIDIEGRDVWVNGKSVHLPKAEFDLLRILLANPDRVIRIADLQNLGWGSPRHFGGNAFYAHLARLRRGLGAEGSRIKSKRNLGYKLDSQPLV